MTGKRLAMVCASLAFVESLALPPAGPALAAVGDLLKTVNLPVQARCISGFGVSLALVPGPMIDRNEPILLVTSCVAHTGREREIYFLDPSTEPATLVHTIVTNPTPPFGWGSLAVRGDKGDMTGCGNSLDGTHAIYSIDINPRNATPDGTATFLFNAQPGLDICDGHTWDTGDNTFYQSPDMSNTIYHFSETGTLLRSFPAPAGCPSSGLAVAGASLFAACSGVLTVHQLDKTNGDVFTSFGVPGQRTEDLEADPVSFASMNKDAMWTKDAVTDQIVAFEIPAGTAGFAGGPPVAPALCTGGVFDPTDTDGDALLDCWETEGIDFDGDGVIDLVLNGADPEHKDVYVEIDYMARHRPNQAAINQVIAAFANAPVNNPDGTTGIRLHVQVDDEVPHSNNLALEPRTAPAAAGDADFDQIKAANFGTAAERAHPNSVNILNAKRFAFHYAFFAHLLKGLGGGSGAAELGGNDLVVSLGARGVVNNHRVGSTDEQAATFMHELGHNFFLRHGGGDRVNCKPNYLSIMSYTRQFPYNVTNRPLDYSHSELPTLDESMLNEAVGIGGMAGDRTAFGPPTAVTNADAGGAIDWDRRNGSTGANVRADLNNFGTGSCGQSPGEMLQGYDDWANLQYNFRASVDFADGVHLTVNAEPEASFDELTYAFQSFQFDKATIEPARRRFDLHGKIELGATSNGIAPTVEDITLEIGTYSTTIPAGSFSHRDDLFRFQGRIGRVRLNVEIEVTADGLDFKAQGNGADLAGTVNPVGVTLTIGDDTATTTVNADIPLPPNGKPKKRVTRRW